MAGVMSDQNEPSLIQLARAGGEESSVEPLNLGARVRELRKARDWTLEQAAREAGLARSTLSKIENAQMSPTFELMKKLAEGLGIGMPQLFTPPSKAQVNGRMDVTRSEMKRGDSAYYDASMGHNVVSTSAEDALILWVTSMG